MSLRPYEVMIILDPTLDDRTIAPSLDTFLNVIKKDGGDVKKVDVWGRRRLALVQDRGQGQHPPTLLCPLNIGIARYLPQVGKSDSNQ